MGRGSRILIFCDLLRVYKPWSRHGGGAVIYSRTSGARTLMARLPRLFRTRSGVPRKKSLAADLE